MSNSQKQQLRQKALDLLARREHSQLELKQKLLVRDFDPAEVDDVIAKLAAEQLQSDERFTECYIRSRANRDYGPIRIQQELRLKGIETAIDVNNQLWFDNATRAKLKKFGNSIPQDLQARAKQVNFLQYKGFTHDQINYAIEENKLENGYD